MLRRRLLGSRLRRAASLLTGRSLSSRRIAARAAFLDGQPFDLGRVVDWVLEEAEELSLPATAETARRLVAIAGTPRRLYHRPRRGDVAVIMAFFNPCGYRLPLEHLQKTCGDLLACGVTPVVSEVTAREPVPLPVGVRRLVYRSDSVLFHKENLLNLAARQTTEPKLLFMDCDLEFGRRGFIDGISESLDKFDVVQPFSECRWLDVDGRVSLVKPAMATAFVSGTEPSIAKYHPGFAWAMTRQAFDALGGFYDKHPLGGGDTAFSYAVAGRTLGSHVGCMKDFATMPSYLEYARNATSLGLRIGYIEDFVTHLWHGTRENRQYAKRHDYLPPKRGTDYPLKRRPDGLLEWTDKSCSEKLMSYFISRREDG